MLGFIRRSWRSRGFGVHSPFAYGYLRSVIRPPRDARYYAEDGMASPCERLRYRVMVEAKGSRVPTLIAEGPRQVAALEAYAATLSEGVLFVHPGRMAILCRRRVPFLRLEVALPRP